MAFLDNNLIQKTSNRVGPFVIYYWKGIPYVRYEPVWRKSGSIESRKQFAKRKLNKILKNLKPVINAGFNWNLDDSKQLESAVSYFLKLTTRKNTSPIIDFSTLPISRGNLPVPEEANATVTAQNNILFSWSYKRSRRNDRANDQALLLAYSTDTDEASWKLKGPMRKDMGYTLELPEGFSGQKVETYLAFTSGNESSDSLHLGSFEV